CDRQRAGSRGQRYAAHDTARAKRLHGRARKSDCTQRRAASTYASHRCGQSSRRDNLKSITASPRHRLLLLLRIARLRRRRRIILGWVCHFGEASLTPVVISYRLFVIRLRPAVAGLRRDRLVNEQSLFRNPRFAICSSTFSFPGADCFYARKRSLLVSKCQITHSLRISQSK